MAPSGDDEAIWTNESFHFRRDCEDEYLDGGNQVLMDLETPISSVGSAIAKISTEGFGSTTARNNGVIILVGQQASAWRLALVGEVVPSMRPGGR
jgi:hypothetical protein